MSAEVVQALLVAKEGELVAKLAAARARFAQSTDRGDSAEVALRDFLAAHLPRWFDVGHGEIIDAQGGRSRQLDVIVSTEDHPFRQSTEEPGLYIAEAIHAVGEVKAKLTTAELSDVVKKGVSAKALVRGQLQGSMVFSNEADHRRWVEASLPFFAFGFESDIASRTLVNRLAAAGDAVDAVFVLGRGAAINFGNGEGAFRLRLTDGRDVSGWAWVEGQPLLLQFLGWLHALPRIRHMQSPFINYLAQTPGAGSLDILFPESGTG